MNRVLRQYVFLLIALGLLTVHGCGREDAVSTGEEGVPQVAATSLLQKEITGRFEQISAEESGLNFVHVWQPRNDREARWLDRSFAGGGVCIGDYDGDGWADVLLTRPHGGIRLYRNLGGWKFEDVTAASGVQGDDVTASGASFADIDNDGDLDLYVCGYGVPNRLFVNQNDGTFLDQAERLGVGFVGASVSPAFADFDLDGDLDLYVVTNRFDDTPESDRVRDSTDRGRDPVQIENDRYVVVPEAEELVDLMPLPNGTVKVIQAGQYGRLYRNDGAEGFKEIGRQAGLTDRGISLAATWWDYNDDGLPDLYVANDFFGADRIYRNLGNGKFADVFEQVMSHQPWYSMGCNAADINNDGRLDFFATDMSGTTHYKSKMSMGDMSDSAWFLDHSRPPQYMRNALHVNTGTGRFLEIAHMAGLANSDWTWAPKFADFDCDGWVDLFISNGMTRDWMNSDAVEQMKVEQVATVSADHVQIKRDRNMAFSNSGNLKFDDTGSAWGLDAETVSFGAAVGDLDNDGDADLIVNNFQETVGIFRNDVASGNRVKIRLVGKQSNRWGIGTTIHLKCEGMVQTRHLTMNGGFMCGDDPTVCFGVGTAESIDEISIQWPSGTIQLLEHVDVNQLLVINEPAESNSDSYLDLTDQSSMYQMSRATEGIRHRENMFDDFELQPLLPNRLSQLGPALAMGDLNGDGADDLIIGGAAEQSMRVYLNRNGRFKVGRLQPFEAHRQSEDIDVVIFDAENDGDLDIYVVSGGYEIESRSPNLRDRLYLNRGNGTFDVAPEGSMPDVRLSGGCASPGDFDGDGDLDLLVGGRLVPGQYPAAPVSSLLRNDSEDGQVTFVDVTEEVLADLHSPGMVTDALWSDMDGDEDLDLILTLEWGPVTVYRNDRGTFHDATKDAGLAKRLGWWNSITEGDVNGDGQPDYLVTNFGLNTKYHPKPDKPSLIYYGDFEGTGRYRIVEAKKTADGCLPVRGKSCSQNAMPFIRDKLPTYHEFAISGLEQIYTEERLDQSLKLEANELRSGLLINDGAGGFRFVPLPRVAQVSPSMDAALVDVNGDGRLDIYMLHNFYSPQRETGRMAGGLSLLLLGHGDGSFDPVGSDRSGLVVPQDARALAVSDLNRDGVPDFIIGVNDGETLTFESAVDPRLSSTGH